LNPEVVVLGGGIMEQTEYLQPRLEKRLEEKLIPKVYKNTKIAFALHKNHAGIIGAYYHYKQSMM
jgi:predicted NBD/HSP70 family sugar kinase